MSEKWKNRGVRYLLLALLACLLTTLWGPAAVSQLPLPAASETDAASYQTPWWDPNKARQCGRLACSTVNLRRGLNRKFEVAVEYSIGEEWRKIAQAVEDRAQRVQNVYLTIFQTVRSQLTEGKEKAKIPAQVLSPRLPRPSARLKLDWQDIVSNKLGWHPRTPLVEVGFKNDQTVIFVPEQPELGLAQQTIVTVNEADSLNYGKPIPELAQEWRMTLRHSLNDALWGYEFDRQYPWGRNLLSAGVAFLFLLLILAIFFIRQLLKRWDKKLSRHLRDIKQSLTGEITNPAISSETVSQAEPPKSEGDGEMPTPSTKNKKSRPIFRLIGRWLPRVKQRFSSSFKSFSQKLPLVSLKTQTILKQQRNLAQLLLRLLFWGQIFLLFAGVAVIALIYPQSRGYAEFFWGQAVFLPLIWMSLSVADKISDFFIDFFLNRWAKEEQEYNPSSNRYTLRASTYSPALKGATTFLVTVLGLVLTVMLIGFDPNVLAGVGGIAFIVAFLSRNLMEDMLNGALILWTDRYAIGDVIKVGEISGLVEDMNIYTTRIRGAEGRLTTVPNGKIAIVENLTKDWSRAEFQVRIASEVDVRQAFAIIREVSDQMQQEAEWQEKILEPPAILGADDISHEGVLLKVWIKTQPSQHWSVGREFRLRVKEAFEKAGIPLGVPQQAISWQDSQTNH